MHSSWTPASKAPKEVPGVRGAVYKNIDTLRRIRRTHNALLQSTVGGPNNNQSSAATNANDEDEPQQLRRDTQADRKPDAPPISRTVRQIRGIRSSGTLGIPVEGGSDLAGMGTRSLCGQLLEHSGFEGVCSLSGPSTWFVD